MAAKKIKKRVSNGISQFHGNKQVKEGSKSAPQQKAAAVEQKTAGKQEKQQPEQKKATEAKQQAAAESPLVITVTRHHYPALKSVVGHHAFIAADGRELRNLLDLVHALEEMAEDTFRHHG